VPSSHVSPARGRRTAPSAGAGNNPFCYHRVTQLQRSGVRERLVVKELAPHEPYDFGRLEIVEEPWVHAAPAKPTRRLPLATG